MDGKLEERAVALILVQGMMRRHNGRRINLDIMLRGLQRLQEDSLTEWMKHQRPSGITLSIKLISKHRW